MKSCTQSITIFVCRAWPSILIQFPSFLIVPWWHRWWCVCMWVITHWYTAHLVRPNVGDCYESMVQEKMLPLVGFCFIFWFCSPTSATCVTTSRHANGWDSAYVMHWPCGLRRPPPPCAPARDVRLASVLPPQCTAKFDPQFFPPPGLIRNWAKSSSSQQQKTISLLVHFDPGYLPANRKFLSWILLRFW
jgi:hypothetical protein